MLQPEGWDKMILIELGFCLSMLALSVLVFGTLAFRYKARIDKQFVLSSAMAGALFTMMLFDSSAARVLQPLIAIAFVGNVHAFLAQIRPPTINQPKRDYGRSVIVGLLFACFLVGIIGHLIGVRLESETFFHGILVAHGIAVIADNHKRSSTSYPLIGILVYGLGIALPQLIAIVLMGHGDSSQLGMLSIISYLCVMAGLIFVRMDEVLQHRETLLRAESSLAREQVPVTDLQMSITLSRILGNAAHSLGTPSVILGGLRDVIKRKGIGAVEGRIQDSLTSALEKIAESKKRISEVNDFIESDNEDGRDVEQMIKDVIRLFEHSLSGVNVTIRCPSNATVYRLKSVLLHLLITQITLHTQSLQRMGVNDRPTLEFVVAVNGGVLKVKIIEGGRANSEFEGLSSEQLKLKATMESVLDSVGGKLRINSESIGKLETEIAIEIR